MNDSKIEPRCSCGYDKSHSMIKPDCHYSGWGWLLFSIGMSAKPIRVDFVCEICKDKIDSSTDNEILKKYVGR